MMKHNSQEKQTCEKWNSCSIGNKINVNNSLDNYRQQNHQYFQNHFRSYIEKNRWYFRIDCLVHIHYKDCIRRYQHSLYSVQQRVLVDKCKHNHLLYFRMFDPEYIREYHSRIHLCQHNIVPMLDPK